MPDKYITVKEVPLKNNCPECYNNEGLRLTFKQRFMETKFYKKITPEIKHEIICKNCENTIYPVQWTEDIELVFKYHHKALMPKKSTTYLKKIIWIITGTVIFVLLTIIVIALTYSNL